MENKDNKQAQEHEAQKANTRTKDSKQELTEKQLEKVAGGVREGIICRQGEQYNPLKGYCE